MPKEVKKGCVYHSKIVTLPRKDNTAKAFAEAGNVVYIIQKL